MKSDDFCIIANNCWGAEVYKRYNLPFNTPVIGLYFYPEDYLSFISDLRFNLETDISFIKNSRHINGQKYPVGIVNGIEIHFLHYETEEDAKAKWTKRCKRVLKNPSRLFFKFDDRDGASSDHIHQFHKMALQNSICFTKDRYPDYSTNFQIEMGGNDTSVMDGYDQFYLTDNHYDLDHWLKTGSIRHSLMNRLNLAIRKLKISFGSI